MSAPLLPFPWQLRVKRVRRVRRVRFWFKASEAAGSSKRQYFPAMAMASLREAWGVILATFHWPVQRHDRDLDSAKVDAATI